MIYTIYMQRYVERGQIPNVQCPCGEYKEVRKIVTEKNSEAKREKKVKGRKMEVGKR